MDDLISEFIAETRESLEELDQDLVNLEQNPNDHDLLSKIFRLKHTIKGTCGFLGLPRLEKVAHHAENVLGRFRDGDLEVTPEYVTLIFESIDTIKGIIDVIAETGSEPAGDDSALIRKLDEVYESDGSSPAPAPAEEAEAPKPAAEMSDDEKAAQIDRELAEAFGEPVMAADAAASPPPEEAPTPTPAPAAEVKAENAPQQTGTPIAEQQSLRVNVDVLEDLMTMVSELVLTRNQLLQILRIQSESDFNTPLQRLNQVVSELQEGVMKTRMQPIGNAWAKLPRIIRDLSMELGKKIDLVMLGKDTELDRQVLELIKDPLTHMVRNSGDHGIEDPATRKAAGKPETGTITLNAFHEGGHIIITIKDDGKGLPLEKIKQKILDNGMATPEELAQMSTQQINQFIFRAGFSTAEKVTSVSGRGVGMDVVRTNIEKIGGSIELNSVEGKGSTFTIKIPLTLAIVSALVVAASGERFAIPQIGVRELVMTSEDSDNKIETIKGAPVFRLRERLLPLVSLTDLLKLKIPAMADVEQDDLAAEEKAARNKYIVVTQVGSYEFGIIVDRVYDTEEIVVKPVPSILRDLELFSGNTILGDGSVIMILDPNGIAKATGEIEASADAHATQQQEVAHSESGDKISLLLFRGGGRAPKAVPLSLVARLENIDMSKIEHSNDQAMVQYRGQLMPLLTMHPSIDLNTGAGEMPVLVFNAEDNKSMGLVVEEIIDITEEYIDVQIEGNHSGSLGSAIIDGKATDVVDVGYFLQSSNKDWFKNHGDEPFASANDAEPQTTNGSGRKAQSGKRRVLLVDDSAFFRNMLTPLLGVAGYQVTTLESPVEALKLCEKGEEFDVIVSDIEMPDMDGFEFAEKVKAQSNWQDTPMVALSSHATPQDIDRGMTVGFSKYVAKFDRDTLLSTLSQTLSEKRTAKQ
ncbi:MAG: hybrid sensor histidine kinase/response regulator [Alphaproteobacteria bacterium]|nr:hybrid sensor histidine kinase/response regulator [Alphaproteobacteria bacterium]